MSDPDNSPALGGQSGATGLTGDEPQIGGDRALLPREAVVYVGYNLDVVVIDQNNKLSVIGKYPDHLQINQHDMSVFVMSNEFREMWRVMLSRGVIPQ